MACKTASISFYVKLHISLQIKFIVNLVYRTGQEPWIPERGKIILSLAMLDPNANICIYPMFAPISLFHYLSHRRSHCGWQPIHSNENRGQSLWCLDRFLTVSNCFSATALLSRVFLAKAICFPVLFIPWFLNKAKTSARRK